MRPCRHLCSRVPPAGGGARSKSATSLPTVTAALGLSLCPWEPPPWEWGIGAAPPDNAEQLSWGKWTGRAQVVRAALGWAGCSPPEIAEFNGTSYLKLTFFIKKKKKRLKKKGKER